MRRNLPRTCKQEDQVLYNVFDTDDEDDTAQPRANVVITYDPVNGY